MVLLTNDSETLFKHPKLNNYFLKILKFPIFNALYTQIFKKNLSFKVFNQCIGDTS